ncbi:MAG: RNase adapter RapZ [Lachnoclostridium sp.]|jgi:UPF0042 nucleotide-binding protein|nr:RNase adapter RapZ [Lachnoclostridium sp.]
MKFVIVTGMSGAGKSSVLNMLEDYGYFCVDNLPIRLIPTFIQLVSESKEGTQRVALGLDIRSGELTELEPLLEEYEFKILFLDASTSVLIKRYKETRRSHPLVRDSRVDMGIEKERGRLVYLKRHADYIIDTSQLLIRELKQQIDRIFVSEEAYQNFFLTFVSFGFKYGIPADADLMFDVRFLPNPFYVAELKQLTGDDKEVNDFVMGMDTAKVFFESLIHMLSFLIPNYRKEGKNQLVVAIGCTGGKHRSVAITNAVFNKFSKSEYGCKKEHRDIEKDRYY